MDHQQAVRNHAAEKYLLDELSQEERDGFEEHYFMCVECADEVRSAFSFADNAKAVLAESPRRPVLVPPLAAKTRASIDWFAWLRPAMAMPIAAALLLTVSLYQQIIEIPRLERELERATAPAVLPTIIVHPATRGDDPVVQVSAQDASFQLILDITPVASVSSYTCEVWDAAGNVRIVLGQDIQPSTASVHLKLPAQQLESGRYTVRIRPQGASTAVPVEEYRFELQRK